MAIKGVKARARELLSSSPKASIISVDTTLERKNNLKLG